MNKRGAIIIIYLFCYISSCLGSEYSFCWGKKKSGKLFCSKIVKKSGDQNRCQKWAHEKYKDCKKSGYKTEKSKNSLIKIKNDLCSIKVKSKKEAKNNIWVSASRKSCWSTCRDKDLWPVGTPYNRHGHICKFRRKVFSIYFKLVWMDFIGTYRKGLFSQNLCMTEESGHGEHRSSHTSKIYKCLCSKDHQINIL